jgi:ribosomal protein S18 acetylase RimI-like enzyme
MRNACAGRADAVLVAREGGRVVGFNACLLNGDRAVIDLIAVAETAQGRGCGRKLVDGALACYAGKATEMRVGTQSRNLASLALYRACGFAVVETAMTLHAHLGKHA